MSTKQIVKAFRKYQKASPQGSTRRGYLRYFLPMMLYRTTKTEHPQTTKKMVQKVLGRVR